MKLFKDNIQVNVLTNVDVIVRTQSNINAYSQPVLQYKFHLMSMKIDFQVWDNIQELTNNQIFGNYEIIKI